MKINKFLIINLVIIALTILNLFFINNATQERIKDYSYMIATKVTKQIVTTAYNSKSYHVDNNKLYEIIYGSNDDITPHPSRGGIGSKLKAPKPILIHIA